MKKYIIVAILGLFCISFAHAQYKKLETPILQNGEKVPPREAATANKVNAITNLGDTSSVTVQNGSVITTETGDVLIKTASGYQNLKTDTATTTRKGTIQLAGDLGGTASAPAVLKVKGVAISGTPSAGKSLISTSDTTAVWASITGWTPSFIVNPSTGNDTTGDGSTLKPFRTIDKAISILNTQSGYRSGISVTGTSPTSRAQWNGTAPAGGARYWYIAGGHVQINNTIQLNSIQLAIGFANIDIALSPSITRMFQVYHGNVNFWNGSITMTANNQELFYTIGSVSNKVYVANFTNNYIIDGGFTGLKYVSSSNQENPRYRLNFSYVAPNVNVSTAFAETVVFGSQDSNGNTSMSYEKNNYTFEKSVIVPNMPTYATDAAADADTNLKSGQLYRLVGSRVVYIKP
jgi:hypothetical protein